MMILSSSTISVLAVVVVLLPVALRRLVLRVGRHRPMRFLRALATLLSQALGGTFLILRSLLSNLSDSTFRDAALHPPCTVPPPVAVSL